MNLPDWIELGFAVTIGLAVVRYLIWSVRTQQRFMQNLVENHLKHNTVAIGELTTAIRTLTECVRHDQPHE